MDYMDRQLPGPALHGRAADLLTRVTAANAKGPESRVLKMRAWRGERVHAQAVAWCAEPCGEVRLSCSELKASNIGKIPAERIVARPVIEVAGVPDRLGGADEAVIGTNRFLAVWVTVDVPRGANPGRYSGMFRLTAKGGRSVSYPLDLEVLSRELPEKNDFYLDLWQNACAVARYHHVPPYSKAHYIVLEPLMRELAAAGQKAVTVPICLYPWGRGCLRDEFEPVIRDVRYPDGRCEPDFKVFDEYVAFARSCGVGPHIHCYTILKFAQRFKYWFIDGETGDERMLWLDPDTPEWKAFWRPFLSAFQRHVEEQGWIDDTFIAIDEGDPSDQFSTCAFLKEAAPRLKYACAANKDGRSFAGLDADVYSQILWKDYCSRDFLDTIASRRSKGKITTFYVCTQPAKPNTWLRSPLVETA